MRALIQRVTEASVTVAGDIVGSLDLQGGRQGLVVRVGVNRSDDVAQSATPWRRRSGSCAFLDGEQSASDVDAPVLVISQFTLYANTTKGRRPSWNEAAGGDVAEPLVDRVCDTLRSLGAHVETGRFGTQMTVTLVNDGPVTISLEV